MSIKKVRLSLLLIFTGLSSVLISACSINPAEQINSMLDTNGYTMTTVKYGDSPRQSMDIYKPKIDQGKVPVVFVYGGAWRTGTKTDYKFVGHALAQLGHPVIIPDYQLYPAVKFPVFGDDVAKAIKAVELRDVSLLGRPLREFVIMGHSAGAHTAALITTDRTYLWQNRVDAQVVGMIGLAGPYDLTLENPEVIGVFDGAGNKSQPIDFVRPDLPPVLLIHGLDDARVLPYHTRTFAEKLAEAGTDVRTRFYPRTEHIKVLGSIAQPLRHLNKSYDDVTEFLGIVTLAE